jgi:hypothetical protein
VRNSRSAFARECLGFGETHGLRGEDAVGLARERTGRCWEADAPAWARTGTVMKLAREDVVATNPLTGQAVHAERRVPQARDVAVPNAMPRSAFLFSLLSSG